MSQSSNERGKQTTEFVKRFVRAHEVCITIAFLSLARHPSRVTYSFFKLSRDESLKNLTYF